MNALPATPFKLLDLFSGCAGFSLGLERTQGFRTVAFCDIDPFARAIIAANWPGVPVYEDVTTLTADALQRDGIDVDFITAGFPCTDASIANVEGQGTLGDRTGLYAQAVRLADEFECPILMENVPGLFGRGFGDVLRALAAIRFDAEWECISARELGADHQRERVWILAYPSSERRQGYKPLHGVLESAKASLSKHGHEAFGTWRQLVSGEQLLRSSDGLSVAMERRRLHALGNSLIPQIPQLIGQAILASGVSL